MSVPKQINVLIENHQPPLSIPLASEFYDAEVLFFANVCFSRY